MDIMNYMRHLDPDKWIFDFVVQDLNGNETLIREVRARGGKIAVISKPSLRGVLRYIHQWEHLLREQKCRVIYGHLPVTSSLYLFAAMKSGVSVRVLHSHSTRGAGGGIKNLRNMLLSSLGHFFATHYAACSKEAGRYLFGDFSGHKSLTVIPNAIDCKRFYPNATQRENIRRNLSVKEGELVIGHIGRLAREKNQMFLLRIFAELSARRPAWLWIIGGGPLQETLKHQAKRLGIEQRVRFLGVTRHTEEYVPGFDVFCLPSLFEGEPLTALEAQACGVPCIVSDDVTDKINVTGSVTRLPRSSDFSEWAAALEAAALLGTAAEIAERFRKSRYNIENSIGTMERFLNSLFE